MKIYRDSLSDETEIKDVEELLKYYINNREGLIAYQSQGLNLPEHPDGLEYRNMGTMENHIWSVIAKRMKHSHTAGVNGKIIWQRFLQRNAVESYTK